MSHRSQRQTPPSRNSSLAILVIDDEPEALHACRLTLQMGGLDNVICCQDPREAMNIAAGQPIGAVLLDLMMPQLSGQVLLKLFAQEHPDAPVTVVTSANEIETAVACMRDGAFNYLVKPVESSRLLSSVRRAMELSEWQRAFSGLTDSLLSDTLEHPDAFAAIVSTSHGMRVVFQCVEAAAKTSKPALITGETGVGKEMIARTLHEVSGRTGRFVAVNVAGLDEHLLSDTLFGHNRGAFTGADTARNGLIEEASAGSLFLDEIGDLSPAAQIKLLRLIQEHEYYPLGSSVPRHTDARVIAATHQDLAALQADGRFRRDLYFRLKCHHIHIPPLRERPEDIPLITRHFLACAAKTLAKHTPTPPRELFDLLASYPFPGNVRELESMVFDAVSKHRSRVLSLDTFKAHTKSKSGAPVLVAESGLAFRESVFGHCMDLPTLEEAGDLLVAEAMKRSQGNQTVAARLLGISQPGLSKRLKKTLQ